MSPDVLDGLAQASQFNTIIAVAVGCFIGLVVGMIPGLTISTGIIIVLPLTFVLSPEISIAAKKEGYKTIQEQGRELIEQGTLTFEEYRRTLFLS